MTLVICLRCDGTDNTKTLPLLIRQRKATEEYKIANCYSDEGDAKKQAYFAKYNLLLKPEEEEKAKNHKWSYTARRSHPESGRSWENFDLKKYVSEEDGFIHFPPETLLPGLYEITPKPKGSTAELEAKKCFFSIKTLAPLAVIDGGKSRSAARDEEVRLTGGHSFDPNLPSGSKSTLKFNWACREAADLCRSSGDSLRLRFTMYGSYDVMLIVTSEFGTSTFTQQTLICRPDAALLDVSCKKNCPPVVYIGNVEEETILEVTCSHNCQQAKDKDYEWTIAGSQYDSGKITTGNRGRTFVVSGNVFRPSRNYLLKVSLLRNGKVAGEATFEMTFASKPRAGNCVLYSSARFAVPASFECAEEGAYFYELFAGGTAGRSEHSILTVRTAQSPSRDVCRRFRKRLSSPRVEYTVLEVRRHFPVEYAVWSIPGKILASGYSPDVFYQKFFLPPSGKDKYTVRVSKGIGSSRTLDVSKVVDPEDADRDTPRRKQKYGDRFKMSENSISRLLVSTEAKRRKRGVREFQALVENLVIVQVGNTATKKVLRNFKRSIVADLLKPKKEPLVQELVYVSDGLQILVESKELKKSEPLLSEFTSLICTLIIHKHNEEVKRNPSSGNSQKEAIEFGNALADCLDANSEPDYDLLRPVSYDIVIDEIPSVQFDSVITENYPNYIDVSVDYGQHMENLKKFTFNIINSTAMSAKMLLMTTAMGEHDVKSSGKNSATVVARDKGSNLARTRIHLLNFTLHPSMDFADSEHPFDILLSTWKRDLMWWNHKRTRVATSIVNVQFWHSTCKKRIRHFKAPATVHITMKDGVNFEIQLTEDEIETPKGYGNMSRGDLNSVMRVRRIAIPRHAVLHVNFYNLSLSDALDVVITKSKFPTVDDFAFNTTVRTIGKSFLILPNDEPYDIWGYIGVLPSRRVPSNKTSLSFSMSFTASYCVIWNEEEYVWEPSCVPGKLNTPRVINCECKHFSVLAGYMQNIPSLPQEVQGVDILLELRPCYIIFATLALTFCVYCVLLTLMTFKIEEEVYYLADNCRDDRYAYLVLVRTENRTDAGTTSAVTIRLTGSKRRGEPHVLNYPDPKMRLLQKQGHDLFVLTTSQHLGELVKMEMWFDCSGPSPSWYCRDVLIYDMQERAEWYFKVKTRFHVYKGVTHLEMGPSGKKLPKLKFFKRFTTCNDYHTWNLWAGETNFEFSAKVTAVFSTLLMMYMLLLVTLGVPSMDLRDCMDAYESYRLSWFSFFAAFMSSLVSYVLHVGIAWTFRFSNIEFSAFEKQYRKTHNLTWICWAILIVFIVTSMTCLIVFGFWVPLNNSMIWLTCVVIGTLLDVVVFENAFIIVQTYYCKFRLRYSFDQKFDKFLKVIEQQRVILYQRFDATMLRPFLTHLYKPMRAIEITKRQIIVKLRRVIVDDLEDLLMYGVYNIILYVVILTNRGALTLASKSEMESMFEGAHTRTLPFSKVHSIEQVYDYINKTLIPVMQPTIWYMNFGIDDPGMMVDVTSKYIGVARLRQHRIITNACAIPEVISFLNLSCWPEFSLSNAEVRDFGYGWTKYNSGLEYDRLNYIWGHQSEHYTGTLGSMGEIATYSGGGYVAFLGRTLYNSYLNLLRLYEMYWIDDTTRSVFIEFLTYNANYNIFNAVRLLVEQSATGYVSGIIDISAVRMLFVENEIELMSMVVFVLFTVWVSMLMFKLSVGIYRHFRTFYKRVWLMIDLLINLMSVICIILFLVRMKMVESHLRSLEAVKHNEFISYFTLFYVEDFLTMTAAFLVCIATARLWRFLRFGLFFRILERTLSMASFPLFAVTLAFTVVLIGFGLSGLMIFGNDFTELSTLIKITSTLIQLTLKPEDYPLTDYAMFSIGYAYFSVYLLLMQIVLFTYIIVIIMAYTKAQLEFSVEPDSYTVGDYLSEKIDYIPKLIKYKFRRLRGGHAEGATKGEKKKRVTPKADEFRYANSLGIAKSRVKAMSFIVSCIIRNVRQTTEEQGILTDYEADAMLGVCNQFVLKTYQDDELELFFKGHFEGENFRLVDEKRITKIADVVEMLLQAKREETGDRAESKLEKCRRLIKRKNFTMKSWNLILKLVSCQLDAVEDDLTSFLESQNSQ